MRQITEVTGKIRVWVRDGDSMTCADLPLSEPSPELTAALRHALGEPAPICNPHPKAPHGFNRNASHTTGRYVCDCESWDPYEAGRQAVLESLATVPPPLLTPQQAKSILRGFSAPDASRISLTFPHDEREIWARRYEDDGSIHITDGQRQETFSNLQAFKDAYDH